MKGKHIGKGIVDIKTIAYLLLIPVILMVMVIVFSNFESTTPSAFYNSVTGESVNLTGANNTYVSLANCEQGIVNDSSYPVKLYNSTKTLVEDTNYAVDYTNCKIKAIDGTTNNSAWSCDYSYKRDGYASYESMADQGYNAFSIATIIPLIVIAIVIIGLLFTAFRF
jgi:hypothetical protein